MQGAKKVMLSAVKPTGELHIGVYFGMMKPSLDLAQKHDENYIFIADFHALTSVQNRAELEQGILHVAAGYLAAGFDVKNTLLFKQSDVPAHTELAWVFDCITTMPYLMRAHAYKDAAAKNKEINVGVFNYPMLMAADILLYDTTAVPVGQDQKQHVEYARDAALKFNRLYGDTFVLPEAHIVKGVGAVPGTDGRKMSKSYKNVIPLFGESGDMASRVMSIVTDSKGEKEPKDPETCNIFALHKLVSGSPELEGLKKRYESGDISYKESKEILIERLERIFKPIREKYNGLINDKSSLIKILKDGGERARQKAEKKMSEVREKIGVGIY